MDVRNCRSCGRLFKYSSGPPICDACKNALEEKFTEVKEYIRQNTEAHINKIAEDCDISVKQIKQWVREERLILTESSYAYFKCENCGASIRTGRFCKDCKTKMRGSFESAYPGEQPAVKKGFLKTDINKTNKNKMRFLDN